METHTDTTKRLRHHSHSDLDSPESSKRLRVHPNSSEFDQLARVNPDLLDMLNDADNVTERDPTVLDSVIKSFEEEILAPPPNLSPEPQLFKPNLGYLLEASDDELGLPPTVAPPADEVAEPHPVGSGRVGPEGVDLTGFLGFEDDIGSYEGLGFVGYDDVENNGGGYVTIDGLFDYADVGADILWRSESLQAM
ncbi:uncharacterized protein LOC109804089 [Cajanus cajan]|uniref:Uncharacterized protein n=1 Tax=Cajanus cajan TaxID=3821 RepID=A0A151T3G5_CAJCA|nr:uncharacterized protein LOC109804089 [Cajanus cajan]KYP61586.1 hypothetical protein KK1_016080 [Cajanus cajan]